MYRIYAILGGLKRLLCSATNRFWDNDYYKNILNGICLHLALTADCSGINLCHLNDQIFVCFFFWS